MPLPLSLMAQLPLHPSLLLPRACVLSRVAGKNWAAIMNFVAVFAATAFGSIERCSGGGRRDFAVRRYGLPSFWSLRYLAHDSSDHVAQSSESAAAAVSVAKSGRLIHLCSKPGVLPVLQARTHRFALRGALVWYACRCLFRIRRTGFLYGLAWWG